MEQCNLSVLGKNLVVNAGTVKSKNMPPAFTIDEPLEIAELGVTLSNLHVTCKCMVELRKGNGQQYSVKTVFYFYQDKTKHHVHKKVVEIEITQEKLNDNLCDQLYVAEKANYTLTTDV
jgi:hypothetical protein